MKDELEQIKERNIRVEADKAWETSYARRILISSITYIIVIIFLIVINAPNPYINALIPVTGFLISTLTLPFIKKFWIRKYLKK